ncbi:unnamed protein product, partial [Discosporangium mesarthrocarpum]
PSYSSSSERTVPLSGGVKETNINPVGGRFESLSPTDRCTGDLVASVTPGTQSRISTPSSSHPGAPYWDFQTVFGGGGGCDSGSEDNHSCEARGKGEGEGGGIDGRIVITPSCT